MILQFPNLANARALLRIDGEVLAVAQTTWLSVDRQIQLGET